MIFVGRKRPCCNANHSVIHAFAWPSVLSGPALYAPNPIKISHNTTQISHIGKIQSLWIGLPFCQGLRFKPPTQLKSRTLQRKFLIAVKKNFGLASWDFQ
jgi:hypothetical protein